MFTMTMITATQLQQKIASNEDFLLIDVREEFEHDHFNIGGRLIPMGSVLSNVQKIPKDKEVVFYCEKGIRSNIVIQRLQEKFGYTNLINLTGGMQAWRREVQ
jgi:rhodanese-related sulfurtransferase